MQQLFLPILCLACLTSCREEGAFRLDGKIDPAFEGYQIVLSHHDEELYSDTTVVKNGRFRFEGPVDTTYMYYLSTLPESREMWRGADVALEEGKITVDLRAEQPRVGGTPLNELWQSFEDEYRGASRDSLVAFVIANGSNLLGKQVFFYNYQRFSEREIHLMLDGAGASFRDDERVQLNVMGNRIVRQLRLENEQRENSLNVKYRDFELETPDGGTARISDYVGKSKYLLIDFWATWCGPCIAGMPEMKTLYEKYRDKGVEMIGISLDDDDMRGYWRQVQAGLDTTWPQLGYLKGTDSDLGKAFIVSDIPYVVIIDRAGTIVRYVRMPTHESNLENVLKDLIP